MAKITNEQGLEWLQDQLKMSGDSFRNSKTYKLLKLELQKRGNWKLSPRGNPVKGYKARQRSAPLMLFTKSQIPSSNKGNTID